MCSACSGKPEDPPEGVPALREEEASPFWAWWREPPGDVQEESGEEKEGETGTNACLTSTPDAATRIAGSPAA